MSDNPLLSASCNNLVYWAGRPAVSVGVWFHLLWVDELSWSYGGGVNRGGWAW